MPMSKSRSSSQQVLQLLGQHLLVPAGIQRQLVVGEHIGPLLRRRHMSRAGRRGPSSMPSSFAASTRPWPARIMSCAIDEDRIGEAELSMLSAICRICFFECVRAFLAQGFSSLVLRYSILSGVVVDMADAP